MRLARRITFIVILPFTLLTAYTLWDVGALAVFEHQAATSGGWQVFTDLAIALLLIMAWMVPHARRHGRNPWPYVVLTLVAGSFGPLLYLILSKEESQ